MQTDSGIPERIARIETSLDAAADSLKAISARIDIIGELALSLAKTQERVEIHAEELTEISARLGRAEADIPLIRERFSSWVSVNKGVVLSMAAAATVFSWFLLRIVSDYDSQLATFRDQYTSMDRRVSWVEYSVYKDPKRPQPKEIIK